MGIRHQRILWLVYPILLLNFNNQISKAWGKIINRKISKRNIWHFDITGCHCQVIVYLSFCIIEGSTIMCIYKGAKYVTFDKKTCDYWKTMLIKQKVSLWLSLSTGLGSLMYSISYIRQSSLLQHFFKLVKGSLRFHIVFPLDVVSNSGWALMLGNKWVPSSVGNIACIAQATFEWIHNALLVD